MSPLCILLFWLLAVTSLAQRDNGYTDYVQWDEHSLFVDGERIFIFSGEFHYQRLPVPELWDDVFQKFRANGLNSVSIYFFWSYHSPSQGVFDFTSPGKDIQRLLDAAKAAGLYVIARPGPYCNAETSAGGIALWGTDGSAGDLRTSDQTYYEAWQPWIRAVGEILARNQVTEGGPVLLVQVENELQETVHEANNTLVLYMEQIKKELRDVGIVVPFTSNEKGMRSQSWSTDYLDVGGAVDIYGLDSYPGGLSCSNPNSGFILVRTYYQWFQNYSFTQPSLVPEFRGGWFQPWGGFFYDECESESSPEFPDVFYKNNIANRVTLLNIYMLFGGTNWGHSAAPVVYTSYDYSAPLRETREIQSKFQQTKLISLFTRSSQGLLKTDMESNGTGNAVNTTEIYTWVLRNPDNYAGFYITQHDSSNSQDDTWFDLYVNTSLGPITVPNVSLEGRQSRIVVTDYPIGDSTLLYSSAEILTYGIFDVPVVVFYLNPGQVGEIAFKSGGLHNFSSSSATDFARKSSNDSSSVFGYTQGNEPAVVKFSGGPVLYLLDHESAFTFFAPPTTTSPAVGPDEQIFVLGPYLVRNATVSGDTVLVVGDNDNATTIEVYTGDPSVSSISWNGRALSTRKTTYGALVAEVPGASDRQISLPTLTDWKTADSLPELDPTYDDSQWIVANKTSTFNPVAPITLPVLYGSDYGYYTGILIYRGYFDGRNATAANVTVQGGSAFGWSAWLNGQLVGGFAGNASVLSSWDLLDFSSATLNDIGNVLTVVTDYTGHDQDSRGPYGPQNPRGILGAQLIGGSNFTKWKIQGNAGGDAYIDAVRGPQNEGGLAGERLGWHLPGFDNSEWQSGSPADGFSGAGIRWYRTSFSLDVADDLDVPIGVELSASTTTPARVQLFVNGYQYGKFFPHIGPQTRFPIPPGILNNQGTNSLSLSVWAQTETGAKVEADLFAYGQYVSGFGFSRDWSALQPGWTEERLQYA
ncbi:putative beta-galactosidase C [Phyllosticta capitalensis]